MLRRFYSRIFSRWQAPCAVVAIALHSAVEKKIGNVSVTEFLRKHWQKRPLLVRAALPGFRGVTDFRELQALAKRDDVESRIVERRRGRWETAHGPFKNASLRKTNATL